MYQKFPLGSCFMWIFTFSMLEASVYLPQLLWLYVLIIHTPLDFHTKKLTPIDILKFLFTALSNHDKEVTLV